MATVTDSLLKTYAESDALGLAGLVRRKEVSPAELVEAAATLIDRLNPSLNAVIHRLYDMGRAAAATIDRDAPLAGVPFLLKELASSWTGAPNTNASVYFKDFVATFDTEAVRRMKAAGLNLVGKSNAPENGWSISTEPKLYGATRNPWKADITAGGSSGGTAAAVAARMVPIGEASDGAGSIRIPASCCGVVGLKPSRGRVTLAPFGDFWYGGAYFLCCSRTVRDTAAYLDALAGALPGDPYTPPTPGESWLSLSAKAPKKLRIGYTVTPPNGTPVGTEPKAAVLAAAKALEALGHEVEEHDMALDANAAWKTYTDMTCVQTAAMFAASEQFVGRPVTKNDVEPVTWAIIERGRATGGIAHIADVEQIRQLSRAIAGDLAPYDLFVTPTLTQLPRPVGYYDMSETDLDRYNAKWTDSVFAFPFNISGQPAISLPLHWTADGIPVGVQMVGRYGDEATVLAASVQLEQQMPWKDRRPPVSA
ncbi:amidase [Mesorhizobium sp. L-8-3]|uniref:amidase n=1 Tax=Mesorhizobium sp. L-8-3 TaxID=2744522 RepID=UPI001927C427|nr:amidase [Mesorhizobium sp. L-8-3]BCH21875.1 amidase [Mesorhizobium sp. L-8-3]